MHSAYCSIKNFAYYEQNSSGKKWNFLKRIFMFYRIHNGIFVKMCTLYNYHVNLEKIEILFQTFFYEVA